MGRWDVDGTGSVNGDTEPHTRARLRRAIELAQRFQAGEAFTTTEVMEICGYESRAGAHYLLDELCHILPLTKDECHGGKWYLLNQ